MKNLYNRIDCDSEGRRKNTGFGDCTFDPKLIKGGAKVPSTFKLTKEQLATKAATIAALKAAAKADSPSNRIYPIHGFVNPADNSEDKTIRTAGDGSQVVVREGLSNWSWEFTRGGLSLHRAMRTHNENGGYFIFWDADYVVYGWGKDREIHGIPLNFFWVNPWKQNDGTNPAIYNLQVVFDPKYINDELGFAKLDNTLTDVVGLRDIQIVINEFDGDAGTGNFSLLTDDSQYNLYDTLGDELDDTALYTLVNDQTGEAVSLTSITRDAATKTFDFVVNTADPDYPTLDGETMSIDLVDVSDLEAAGVVGFEGLRGELEISTGS